WDPERGANATQPQEIKPPASEQLRPRPPAPHNPRIRLHNPVMLPYRLWPPLRFAGKGDKERREPIPRRLSRPCAQRGFSSAQLLPAVAVLVAGPDPAGP